MTAPIIDNNSDNPASNLTQVDNGVFEEYITEDDIPTYWEEPAHIKFTWEKYGITAHARHFGNLRAQAELEFWYYNAETAHERLLLPQSRVELTSPTSRAGLIRQLKSSDNVLEYVNWQWIVDCIAFKVSEVSRRQEPTLEIMPRYEAPLTPDYLLDPVLPRGHPTVIFGDKGTFKSLTALVIAYIVQLPYIDNSLDLAPIPGQSCVCLYLDYEDEESSITKRWTALHRGFRDPNQAELEMPILYRRMSAPLIDSVESLRSEIVENHVGLVIVDSLGPAAGGNLYDPQPAIEYHQALRALGVTSLTLAHNSKDPLAKRKSIFGSVFFTNLTRSIWETEAEPERMDRTEVTMSLAQRNSNLSAIHAPLGFQYRFDNSTNSIAVAKVDLAETSLADRLSYSRQILYYLREGAKTIKQISDDLDISIATVRVTLSRLSKETQARVVGTLEGQKLWGLPTSSDVTTP
jgi:hypothetical protein